MVRSTRKKRRDTREALKEDRKADYIVQYDGGAARGYRNNGKTLTGKGSKWNDMGRHWVIL
ncbi:hypothetical protein ACHAPI_001625 [Fusarium lateritium]